MAAISKLLRSTEGNGLMFCADSTHALSGKTVPLPDFDS